MRPLYATAPSTFLNLPGQKKASQLQQGLRLLANYFSDAHLAQELFDGAAARPFDRRARREQLLYVQAFVFALDYFVKQLGVMAKEVSDLPALKEELADFNSRIPGIEDLRDSLHHVEDRARGLRKNKGRIKPHPIDKFGFQSEGGGLLFVGPNISGSKVFCTAGDGRLVEIDICRATLEEMIVTLQRVIDALPWHKGWPCRYPDTDF
jgi:hypothetical protein